jgi:hypothetical protein
MVDVFYVSWIDSDSVCHEKFDSNAIVVDFEILIFPKHLELKGNDDDALIATTLH